MKLKNEKEFVKKQFAENLDKIKEYAPKLKAHINEYDNFEIRLTWDCLYAFIGSATMCDWYNNYDCNDKHITTLGMKVLKELGVI